MPSSVTAIQHPVFVVDMESVFSTASVPGTQAFDGGGSLPTVTAPAAANSQGPAVTIPSGVTAPTALQVSTLITGTGPAVTKGQNIAVQYTGVNWRTGKVFDSSWARNAPYTVLIGEGQVIKGWDTGLAGQTVGSRVLLVLPPTDGYGQPAPPRRASRAPTPSSSWTTEAVAPSAPPVSDKTTGSRQ